MIYKANIPFSVLHLDETIKSALKRGNERAAEVARNGVRDSIRKRWFKTGRSAESFEVTPEISSDGQIARIKIESGTSYDIFGEYGTGLRGALTRPKFVPNDWTYGSIPGMESRFMFHLGVEEVLPEIIQAYSDEIKEAFK